MLPDPQQPSTLPSTPPAGRSAAAQAQGAAGTAAATPAVLATQLVALRVQLAGLKAEWNGLQDQLQNMRLDNPARAGVQAKWADIGEQQAHVEGQIAQVETQLGRQGQTNVIIPPGFPIPIRRGMDPDLEAGMIFAIIFAVLMPIAIGIGRRVWRSASPAPRPRDDTASADRLGRMEQALDAVAIEVERISESQRFMTRVFTEGRGTSAPSAASGAAGSSASANGQPAAQNANAATVDGASPVLALGAGPIEPVRVNAREAARQSAALD
jgi:hypothetical protein